MRFFNFGSLNIDYTYHMDHFVQPGETQSSLSLSIGPGGKGLNQSIALARAGAEVSHVGITGQGGEFLRMLLAENGVDISLLGKASTPNGHAIIQVDQEGQNCIVLYGGTNQALTQELIDNAVAAMEPGDAALLQNETNEIPYIIRKVRQRGCDVILNAAPMGPEVQSYPLELVSCLIVNETEGSALSGCRDPEAILEALARRWPETRLLLTLGTRGSIYLDHGKRFDAASKKVTAVDTTAAGDTYTGFFLSRLYAGDDPAQAMKTAAAASALAVTRPGAAGSIPKKEELQNF